MMLLHTEPLSGDCAVQLEVDLRYDDAAQVLFFDDLDGLVLQLSGNGADLSIRLDHYLVQDIIDQLAAWGYISTIGVIDP